MTKMALALSALLSATALAVPAAAQNQGETLYRGMNGLRASENGTLMRFSAMLVDREGRVVHTYAPGVPEPKANRVVEMQGAHVLPGLIDAHGHLANLGRLSMTLDLTGVTSIKEMQDRIAAYAGANPDAPWIIGRGWNQELFADARFPTAADLDAVVADRPVWLERVDGHAKVGNGKLIEAAAAIIAKGDPQGGRIDRDAAGKPTGLFIDNAMLGIDALMPARTFADEEKAMKAAQQAMLSVGLTGVADMGIMADEWETLRRLGAREGLNVRVMAYAWQTENLLKVAPDGPTPWLFDDTLRMVGVKLMTDGALGSRGAWLKQPYADADTHGLPMMSDGELQTAIETAIARGHQVATHAIGDKANAQILSAYEALGGGQDRRLRIEHVQILDPADLDRLAKGGVIASMQPIHQTSDWKMAEKRLGDGRLDAAYAWRAIIDSGARMAFGSDFPVESPNPFPALEVAVTRTDANGEPQGGWYRAQAVTLGEALAAFTHGAAYAGKAEDRFGGLSAGQYADFIIVDRDISQTDIADISETRVKRAYLAGELRYDASAD